MGLVDFSAGSAISLFIYRLLSKLRSGRQQQVTVEALEQMQESGNKIPKETEKIVENLMQLQNSWSQINSRPPCKSTAHKSRIRHKRCYFSSDASHCFEVFHYKNKSPDWVINHIFGVFSFFSEEDPGGAAAHSAKVSLTVSPAAIPEDVQEKYFSK